MQLQFSMNEFFHDVNKLHLFFLSLYNILIVSGNQNHPGAGGYGVDQYQNTGGVLQQLLALARSVRTVMRGKFHLF